MQKYNPKKSKDILKVLNLLKEGAVIMVLPYDDDEENFTGVTIEDFEDETDEEIMNYFIEKDEIEFWDEMINI
jgi:hypothetical protein